MAVEHISRVLHLLLCLYIILCRQGGANAQQSQYDIPYFHIAVLFPGGKDNNYFKKKVILNKLLHLGKKNNQSYLVLRSNIYNFAPELVPLGRFAASD